MKLIIGGILGFILGISIPAALPAVKSFDELKWERLALHREKRRATERRYESCVRQCERACK